MQGKPALASTVEEKNMTDSTSALDKGLGGYGSLAVAAGIGSMLGSGIIVGLSSTITVWQPVSYTHLTLPTTPYV